MDEEHEPGNHHQPASKMSKTPSWVMLGFVLGAAFVLAIPEWREPPPPEPAPVRVREPEPPPPPRPPPPLSRIEAVFAEWGRYAVWDEDITQVALWDPVEERFSDYYEVRRVNGVYYFRSIPRLTNRIINRGKQLAESPLQFTETEEQFRDWDERDRAERPFERMWQLTPPRLPPETPPARPPAAATPKVDPVIETPKPGTSEPGR